MGISIFNSIYPAILREINCIFCKKNFTGPVCDSCSEYLYIRRPPFCESCGIRIVSEIQYCGRCREGLESSSKSEISASEVYAEKSENFLCSTSESSLLNIVYHHCYSYSLWTFNAYSSYLISRYKKEGFRILGYYLALKYYSIITDMCHSKNIHSSVHPICIIPIPANPKHIRKVGFDHMKLVCKYLQHMNGVNILYCIARHESLEQKTLGLEDRIVNMSNTLYLSLSHRLNTVFHKLSYIKTHISKLLQSYSTIVLLDDVITTGATINATIQLLSTVDSQILSKIKIVSLVRTEY